MAHNEKQTWHAIEEQAYHAFREWPIWLVLRQIELSQHLQQTNPPAGASVAPSDDSHLQPEQPAKSIRSMS